MKKQTNFYKIINNIEEDIGEEKGYLRNEIDQEIIRVLEELMGSFIKQSDGDIAYIFAIDEINKKINEQIKKFISVREV